MKRIIGLFMLVSVSPLFAQQPLSGPGRFADLGNVTKVITLKYPDSVNLSVINGIGLTVRQSGDIVVVTGPPDRVDTAEAILKQLDVPPQPRPSAPPRKSIQLTAYLVIASRSEVPGAPLPKDLESPVNQVASVFPYKSFNLLDAIDLRLTNNSGGQLKGVLPQGQQTFPRGGEYTLDVGDINLTEETPVNLIRVRRFSLMVNNVKLATDVDVKEGQKAVIGKANIDGNANALIVVLSAKVVE